MTKAEIEAVLDRVRSWPADKQEVVADFLRMLDSQTEFYEPSEEEMAAINQGLAEADRGEFATEEEVEELLGRPWIG
jgi:predicted transcriptional regulator